MSLARALTRSTNASLPSEDSGNVHHAATARSIQLDSLDVVGQSTSTLPLLNPQMSITHTSGSGSKPSFRPESQSRSFPPGAKPLRRRYGDTFFSIALDLLFAAFSALFFVFGLFVARYRGDPVSDHPEAAKNIISIARIGPTFFPILFAAVAARTLKAIMALLLHRGAKLGLLDLLAGSTTVSSTFFTQISLRAPSIAGVFLIVAWALSPLGGQASLRVVTLGNGTSPGSRSISYMDFDSNYDFVGGDIRPMDTILAGLFNAALYSPGSTKQSSMDTWQNVKIPFLEDLSNNAALLANNTWIEVPGGTETNYTSLIGIPTTPLEHGNAYTNFTMETSYFILDCPVLIDEAAQNGGLTNPLNITEQNGWKNTTSGNAANFFTNSSIWGANNTDCTRSPDNRQLQPRYLAYEAWDPSSQKFGAICTIRTIYVEVEVACTQAKCWVKRMRNSTRPASVSEWTVLDGQECANWTFFTAWMTSLLDTRGSGTATPVQTYFVDPTTPAMELSTEPVASLDKRTFAMRFAQLLNSFWLVGMGPFAITIGLSPLTAYMEGWQQAPNSTNGWMIRPNVGNVTADVTYTYPVIQCRSGWLAALIVSSLFLIAACILSAVIRAHILTPDLALNWSTVIRDNPHIQHPDLGSYMNDSERSRLMKDQKVQFGDVAGYREVGHLAVASIEAGGVMRPTRDRLFD